MFPRFMLFMSVIVLSNSLKILGFFPFNSKSHYAVFLPLMEELARRGHNVTVVSHIPTCRLLKNCDNIQISLPQTYNPYFLNMDYLENNDMSAYSSVKLLWELLPQYDNVMEFPQVKNLLNIQFDILITEMFNSDSMFGFLHKCNAPIIGFSSSELFIWHEHVIGVPLQPSQTGLMLSKRGNIMNFWDRMLNTIEMWICTAVYHFLFRSRAQILAEKQLGPLPDLAEIVANTSLVLINSHFSILGAKPRGPNVIEVGGIHLKPVKPLPEKIQDLMDQSKYGIIYVSFGSSVNTTGLKKDKIDAFSKVFSHLKQTVLWKFDSAEKSGNVMLSPWFPQQDILVHPKVLLFISQCGILSIIESINAGVPLLCIPLFSDQYSNSKSIEFNKAGLLLDFKNITQTSVNEAIQEILTNPTYKKNALRLSEAFKDRPMSPMDSAVYWVEYVARHNGAAHIKIISKDLPWYKYHNLDVIISMFLLILFITVLSKHLLKLCLLKLLESYKPKLKTI